MVQIVIPVFTVILVGYLFGRRNQFSPESEKLINDYVLYVALPALLFIAVARSNPGDLAQWNFVLATLAGIGVAYIGGIFFAKIRGVNAPQSSLVGMASCYGTTGYMGIPILITAFGPEAAVPAAIATILHNIPAIITVIVTHDAYRENNAGIMTSIGRAFITTLRNPLMMAVLAGAVFSLLRIPLPNIAASFAQFLGNAAGPTALFALGLGLARISTGRRELQNKLGWIAPVALLKIVVQPVVTFAVLILMAGTQVDIWFATAIVMAAQPIGAGAYVFSKKYEFFDEEISIAIIISLLVTVITLMLILQLLSENIMI